MSIGRIQTEQDLELFIGQALGRAAVGATVRELVSRVAAGNVLTAASAVTNANAPGSSLAYARADHDHLLAPARVAVLPTSGLVENQLCFFQTSAMATDGVMWVFQYRGAEATYKWEFVGGPPWVKKVDTQETTTSTSYAALATAGPSVTLPLAGDYIVAHGSQLTTTAGASTITSHSYDIGGTGASDTHAVVLRASGSAVPFDNVARTYLHSGLSAVALVSKYKTGSGTATFEDRWMSVLPVRVI